MTPAGYNPMRHDCQRTGCFIRHCRPKSEWFCSLFPGKISFSDLDRIVEIDGRGLIFEWKSAIMSIPRGQDIMWRRLTRGKLLTVFCAAGNVSEMQLDGYAVYFDGEFHPWVDAGIIEFTERISKWVEWAHSNAIFEKENT